MMGEPSLKELERDVVASRAKLAGDLAMLRAPSTFSSFKDDLKREAVSAKDSLVDSAKSAATSSIQNIIEDLKAKAAANPAATLAIGAGIAWRLIHHPPIATALVGAGLFSLLRTTAPANGASSDAEYFAQAKERLKEQTGEAAGVVKEHIAAMAEGAKEKVQEWSEQTSAAAQQATSDVKHKTVSVAQQASKTLNIARRDTSAKVSYTVDGLRRAAQDATATAANVSLPDTTDRDKFLLGAAGFAVAAALGLALRGRSTSDD
jgi:hypothetical protein